ncbi:MAG: ABC transporter permease [Clostridia bacterium]|nr:ABC transporter permease [Clostridia bacterium]
MTSRKSFFNIEIMLETLKQQKYIMILHTVALFLMTTLPGYMTLQDINVSARDVTMFFALNPLYTISALAVGVFTILFTFSYLFKTNSMQFYASMPYSRECMYISKFAACAVSAILPLAAILLINSGVYAVMGLYNYFEYSDMLLGVGAAALGYLTVLALGAFAVSVAGNSFASIVIMSFVWLVYPVTALAAQLSADAWLKNMRVYFKMNGCYVFPPAMNIYLAGEEFKWQYALYAALYIAVFFALGLICIKKRRNENTNKFFVYPKIGSVLKYYIAAVASLGFGTIVLQAGNYNFFIGIIGYVLMLFIIYSALQAIFDKDMRGMFKNLKRFALFAVIWVVVIGVMIGIFNNIKPIASLCSEMNVWSYGAGGQNIDIVIEDKGNIERAIALLSETVESGEEGRRVYVDPYPNNPFISMTWNESVAAERFEEFYGAVVSSDGYKASLVRLLEAKDYTIQISAAGGAFTLAQEQDGFDAAVEALVSDVQKYSYEEEKASGIYAKVYLWKDAWSRNLYIYSCYEDTIDALENAGLYVKAESLSNLTLVYEGKVIFETSDTDEIKTILSSSAGGGSEIYAIGVGLGVKGGYEFNYASLSNAAKKLINPESLSLEELAEQCEDYTGEYYYDDFFSDIPASADIETQEAAEVYYVEEVAEIG